MDFPISKFVTDGSTPQTIFNKVVALHLGLEQKALFFQAIHNKGLNKVKSEWSSINPGSLEEGVNILTSGLIPKLGKQELGLLSNYTVYAVSDEVIQEEQSMSVFHSLIFETIQDNNQRIKKALELTRVYAENLEKAPSIFDENAEATVDFLSIQDIDVFLFRIALGVYEGPLHIKAIRGSDEIPF